MSDKEFDAIDHTPPCLCNYCNGVDTYTFAEVKTHSLLQEIKDILHLANHQPLPKNIQYTPLQNINGLIRAGVGTIAGFAITETSGTNPLTVKFHEGTDISAPVILPVKMVANDSKVNWFLPMGIPFEQGLFVEITGSLVGTLFLLN